MTISTDKRTLTCEKCRLYLTVGERAGLLARSRALITADGTAFESARYKVLKVEVTLFDIKVDGSYPFDEAVSAILTGHECVFDIAMDIQTPKGVMEGAVIRQCLPDAPSAWRAAGCRWTFHAFPPESVWDLVIDNNWKGGE